MVDFLLVVVCICCSFWLFLCSCYWSCSSSWCGVLLNVLLSLCMISCDMFVVVVFMLSSIVLFFFHNHPRQCYLLEGALHLMRLLSRGKVNGKNRKAISNFQNFSVIAAFAHLEFQKLGVSVQENNWEERIIALISFAHLFLHVCPPSHMFTLIHLLLRNAYEVSTAKTLEHGLPIHTTLLILHCDLSLWVWQGQGDEAQRSAGGTQ